VNVENDTQEMKVNTWRQKANHRKGWASVVKVDHRANEKEKISWYRYVLHMNDNRIPL
jgi:hypothetical protein